jgi:hypothetical protein
MERNLLFERMARNLNKLKISALSETFSYGNKDLNHSSSLGYFLKTSVIKKRHYVHTYHQVRLLLLRIKFYCSASPHGSTFVATSIRHPLSLQHMFLDSVSYLFNPVCGPISIGSSLLTDALPLTRPLARTQFHWLRLFTRTNVHWLVSLRTHFQWLCSSHGHISSPCLLLTDPVPLPPSLQRAVPLSGAL